MKTIYLSGTLDGDPFRESWRRRVKIKLRKKFKIINPMDYKYQEGKHRAIVNKDRKHIRQSNILIVDGTKPGWGTAMEMFYAKSLRKKVYVFVHDEWRSPWLINYSSIIFEGLDDIINFLLEKGLR